ncbi:MAG: glycosyltransferase family 2 protein [bacterium]|nr:glycosyltransferase family 2 protein [bacterium]
MDTNAQITKKVRLSIIIPIYNEEELLPEVLIQIRSLPWENKELILVNDCSTDRTEEILEPEKTKANTIVIKHHENKGKGAAIRSGLLHFTGDIVIIQDADMEYCPDEILDVALPIALGETKVCFGSRFMGTIKDMRYANRVGNVILAHLVSLMYGQRITDEATAYKAFHRSVIEKIALDCQGFEFCPEITSKVLKMGYPVKEVPVTFVARSFAEGKKIGWRDFIVAVWTMLKIRLFWKPEYYYKK